MSTARILDFHLSCIGGLEDVAIDELQTTLGPRIQGLRVERGEVGGLYFRTEVSPRRLLELRCPTAIEAVAAQAHDVTVGQPGLQRILRCVRGLPLDAIKRLVGTCAPDTDVGQLDLRVTQRGAHRFTATEIETGARPILADCGFQTVTAAPGVRPLRLAIRVRKRRVLMTIALGNRRPVGDPQREGWAGPAQNSISRVLDLDESLPVFGLPAAGGHRGLSVAATTVVTRVDALPVATGRVPLLLLVPDLDAPAAAGQLQEAVRAVTPGGVLGLLVRRGEQLAALLRELDLPVDVMATLPYYVRRRRCALFLLERLDLVGIESA